MEHFTYIRTSKHTYIFSVEYFSVIPRYKDKFTGDIHRHARKFFISISVTILDCVIQVDSNSIHTIFNILSWKLSEEVLCSTHKKYAMRYRL